jgi:phosphonate metabolism protein PhnN/1,5-bisphosphokinase (PRPP-forming)
MTVFRAQPSPSRRPAVSANGRRGTLFLVVGPSGVGKDSLIGGAREILGGGSDFAFPRRYITRPPGLVGEAYWALNREEFAVIEHAGAFALCWEAHGFRYGISRRIEDDLAAGRHVVVNASRAVIEPARALYHPVRVVSVVVSVQLLEERLRQRGRESAEEIGGRLARAETPLVAGADVLEINNSPPLEQTVPAFVRLLRAAASSDP